MQFRFRLITVMEFDFCEFSGLKEVRSKITIPYWRPPEGFHFHWKGLKSHFFQFETLRIVIYNPLEGSPLVKLNSLRWSSVKSKSNYRNFRDSAKIHFFYAQQN